MYLMLSFVGVSTCGDYTCGEYHELFGDSNIRIGIPTFTEFAVNLHFVKHTQSGAVENTSYSTKNSLVVRNSTKLSKI